MRAVIYVRVSTVEQVENLSLDTQRRACTEYCRREGIEVDSVFVEEGESAKTLNRPQLQNLLEHCRKNRNRIGFVVVYNVSRLARQVIDHQTIRLVLLKLGVRVRAVTEAFDDTASGKLVENMLAVIAQFDKGL